MVDINLNNYEEKIIDYFDGKLNHVEVEMLMSFLRKHPNLEEEFNSLKDFHYNENKKEQVNFDQKTCLKKESLLNNQKSNFAELCIASIEGDLNDQQQEWFRNFIKYDEIRKRELELFKLTKLSPDNQIVFTNKKSLRRNSIKLRNALIASMSAAASVAIIIAMYITMSKPNLMEEQLIVREEVKETTIELKSPEPIINSEEAISRINKITKTRQTTIKANTPKVEIEASLSNGLNENLKREYVQWTELTAKEIKLDQNEHQGLNIITDLNDYEFSGKAQGEQVLSLRSFVAQTINKALFNKRKDKIEAFDIAQAGVKGINKIAGTKMTLERVYDINGNPKETQFTSRLIAFSAPVKK